MTPAAKSLYAGYRFPGEIISHAVWLYFRFPLRLRMVEEMLAARGIVVSHETVRQWARKLGAPNTAGCRHCRRGRVSHHGDGSASRPLRAAAVARVALLRARPGLCCC